MDNIVNKEGNDNILWNVLFEKHNPSRNNSDCVSKLYEIQEINFKLQSDTITLYTGGSLGKSEKIKCFYV